MTTLRIYPEDNSDKTLMVTEDGQTIGSELAAVGVRFERWSATADIEGASDEAILSAYQPEIDRLINEAGYQSYDVVHMVPDHPQRVALREKFLSEHTHGEDEVRFFVAGQGLFNLHIGQRVYSVLCCRNDLISVPANTPHWFDMGPAPRFTAIRLFNNPEGWVAQFTGSDIADRFPLLDV
ncbi:MAG: hypothetical protein SVU69_13015 [Pseudomonadota bacterium]|nr:hypothetical protein [Pseudomonadota bacterium]